MLYIENVKKRVVLAAVWFTLVQFIQLSWFTATDYHGVYILFVYIGLSIILGFQFGFISFFITERMRINQIFAVASIWTILEWSRLYIFSGFAWNPVGLSMSANLYSMQLAAIVGIYGLSFYVILLNLLALKALFLQKRKHVVVFGFCSVLPFLFGFFHIRSHETKVSKIGNEFTVALIQTGIRPEEKNLFAGMEESYISPFDQWRSILELVSSGDAQKIDLIVLPEAALPLSDRCVYLQTDVEKVLGECNKELPIIDPILLKPPLLKNIGEKSYVSNGYWFKRLGSLYGADVIAGLETYDNINKKSYNSAIHYGLNREWVSKYDKQVLLPLAEYLPISFLGPLVAKYGIVDFFSKGEGMKVFDWKKKVATSICYEECFNDVIRMGRKKGGELLVNITNDAWFPGSKLPEQHFFHGRVRAVENGAYLLRSCNTGVTSIIDCFGRVESKLSGGEWERGVLVATISPLNFETPFTFWGNGFILSVAFLLIVLSQIIKMRGNHE